MKSEHVSVSISPESPLRIQRPLASAVTGEEMSGNLLSQMQTHELSAKQAELKYALLGSDVERVKAALDQFSGDELNFHLNTQINFWNPSPLNALVRPEDGVEATPLLKTSAMFLPDVKEEDRLALVEYALQRGANPNWKISDVISRNTAPFQVCYAGRLEDLKLLERYGADLFQKARDFDIEGITLAMAAAADGRLDILKYLRDKGLDLSACDSKGRNALHWLMLSGKDAACFSFLLQQGVDPFVMDDVLQSPFTLCIEFAPSLATECLQTKIQYKGNMYNQEVYKLSLSGIEVSEDGGTEPVKTFIRRGKQTHATKNVQGRSEGREASILGLAVHHKRTDVLNNPLMRNLVEMRWEVYGKTIFYTRVLFFSLFLLSFAANTALFPSPKSLELPGLRERCLFGMMVVTYLPLLLEEVLLARSVGVSVYLKETSSALDLLLFVAMLTVFSVQLLALMDMLGTLDSGVYNSILACASLIVFAKGLPFMKLSKFGGPLVLTIQGMVIDALKFFSIFLIIYFGFVHAFFVLNKDSVDHSLTYWQSIVTMYFAVLGESLDGSNEASSDVSWFAQGIFSIWLLLATLGLVNVLIALFNDTYARVAADADSNWLLAFAEAITYREPLVPKFRFEQFRNRCAALSAKTVKEPLGKYSKPKVDFEKEFQHVQETLNSMNHRLDEMEKEIKLRSPTQA